MDSSSHEPIPSLPIADPLPLSPPPVGTLTTRLDAPPLDFPEPAGVRRRCKSRAPQTASPRNARKSRRRTELEIREEKDSGLVEEVGKPRKKRPIARTKKEKTNSVAPLTASPKSEEGSCSDLDRVGQVVSDLIMWKDASKSTFWFGFGSLCLLSSCFTQGLNFSHFMYFLLSFFTHLMFTFQHFLGLVAIGDSLIGCFVFLQFNLSKVEKECEVKLKEDDILSLAKLILPALNFSISKMRVLFSGEPSMTLKVVPFLLLGAEYGHLITIWRLCAIGFFVSFSVPKLYSCYTVQINQRAESLTLWLLDTWSACTHRKKVIASVLTAFWNLSSIKTRIFTIFILLVLFRYLRQHVELQLEENGETQEGEKEQKASVVAEPEEKESQQALVVREQGCQN
ncbi:Reticulon-like protein B17, partial [Mucuna pruriens]